MVRHRTTDRAAAGEAPLEAPGTSRRITEGPSCDRALPPPALCDSEFVLPLLREEVTVQKEVVETGRVAVARVTREHSELIAEPLTTELVEISRVPIGRQVDTMPAVSDDGETVVIPVVEERLLIERQLILKEEVRVRRVRTSGTHRAIVTLRHHEVAVNRDPGAGVSQPEEAADETTRSPFIPNLITNRSRKMKYQTIAAAFDTRARAQAAEKALQAAGFHAADISILDKELAPNDAIWTGKNPSLWQRIFGGDVLEHEATVYHQTVERGGAVVSVRVPDNEVAHATGVLDLYHPIDVRDRALTSGFAPAPAKKAVVPMTVRQEVAVSPGLAEIHDQVLPLAEEQLQVGKKMIETGKTRVRRFVTERDVAADVTLHEEHAEVIRRAVTDPKFLGDVDWADREIEVVETAEQALVNKTARVVEEVLLKKVGSDHVQTLHEKVRLQQVNVERVGPDGKRIEELVGAGAK